MKIILIGSLLAAIAGSAAGAAPGAASADTFPTPAGPLTLTFLGHGTLRFSLGATEVYVDPVSRYGNFAAMPKADLVLVTHQHGDHLDAAAIEALRKPGTVVVATKACAGKLPGATVLTNGESGTWAGVRVEAVPAYNLEHKRPDGTPFHPKGEGNGYVLTLGGKRIYVAGDTENIPEMAALEGHRHRLPAHEPALHHDAGDGGRRRPLLPAEDPLPVPLRRHRPAEAGGPAQGPAGGGSAGADLRVIADCGLRIAD